MKMPPNNARIGNARPAHSAPRIGRRSLLAGASASLAACGLLSPPSIAETPRAHTFKFGAFEITLLSDGNLVMPPPSLAVNAEPGELRAALALAGQANERIEPPCNVTLIRTQTDIILVDVGAGPHFVPTAGRLLANLQAAGLERESITKVVYTHAHPDHLWGTLDDFDASPNFPNATYVIAAAEWNFWSAEDAAAKLPDERKFFAASTRRNLAQIKDRIVTVTPGQDIAPGLRAVDTAGHTAGHMAIEVAAGREALLIAGDALTHPVISFAHPGWKPAADHHDADQAIRTRMSLLDRLATDRSLVIGYHLPQPGLGRVERRGSAYAYVAAGS